jgi:hypothetical protein
LIEAQLGWAMMNQLRWRPLLGRRRLVANGAEDQEGDFAAPFVHPLG